MHRILLHAIIQEEPMAAPSEKLAQSLEELRKIQSGSGIAVIRSSDLSRTHRDRLIANGFIFEVIKGWYIATRPEIRTGDTTSWFTSFWYFASVYLRERFGTEWCLSPEQSLQILSGNMSVPRQLIVQSPKGKNNKVDLPHGTSFFDFKSTMPQVNEVISKDGLNVYSVASAFILCSPSWFSRNPTDARTALSMIRDSSEILPLLLKGGHTTIAGRLAGAFRNIGRTRIADDIIHAMKSAGYAIRESDPFADTLPSILHTRETSPYANRIRLMWHQMRQQVIDSFPAAPGLPTDAAEYITRMNGIYTSDAYHSLSIEGYRVSEELIEKVRKGKWNPDRDHDDRGHLDAMAARGYWQAFQAVSKSIREILKGKNAGQIALNDHGNWYRELFAPSVQSGILKPSDLAGYRSDQVFIKGSMHTPPKPEAVRDAMPVLFEMLEAEKDASVRAVLGHFIFVYIHPYMDGNGRIGRFLMNAMLASGGYSWTVIHKEQRSAYMAALEKASVDQDIVPFAKFIASQMSEK